MDESEFIDDMNSPIATTRMRAAQWAVEHPECTGLQRVLMEAASREVVPQIRQVLFAASAALEDETAGPTPTDVLADESSLTLLGPELAGVLEHELRPSIGLLRLAANSEIRNFGTSQTNAAIESFRQRIDGLVRLVEAYALPKREATSLYEFLTSCAESVRSAGTPIYVSEINDDDIIHTDRGLLRLIVMNALQNALDATAALPPETSAADSSVVTSPILLSAGVSDRSFWVTVTNKFVGAAFEHEDIVASGRTSKRSHLGLGTRIMALSASHLNYQLAVTGVGGQAMFSLRGGRYV